MFPDCLSTCAYVCCILQLACYRLIVKLSSTVRSTDKAKCGVPFRESVGEPVLPDSHKCSLFCLASGVHCNLGVYTCGYLSFFSTPCEMAFCTD